MANPLRRTPETQPFTPAKVKDLYQTGLKPLRLAMQDYWLNHAFLEGYQWLWVEPSSREIRELPRDSERYQATINRMAHSTRSIMSKFTQRELLFEVLPDAATDLATKGAQVAESVLEGVHRSHSWESKREIAGRAAWKGGTAIIAVDWNPNAGETLFDAGLDAGGEFGERDEQAQAVAEGDTVETVLSIAEFVVEPGVKDAERARWWIKAQALPPSEVQSTYDMPKPPPADATASLNNFSAQMLATNAGYGETNNGGTVELTLVLTYYERPNNLNRKGRVAVVVDGKFVDGPKDWPFPWTDRLNFGLQRETPKENTWQGSTILSEARLVQVAYNAAWSNVLEHMKLAGNARLLIDAGAADMMDQFTDLPGEMLPWASGTPRPEWLTPAPMPDWVLRQPGELAAAMDDILGIHDVSRGSAPANIESGYGLSILAEQDNSPVGRMVKDSANAWQTVATMVLKLYEAETTATRRTTIQRNDTTSGPRTVQWTGDTLAGQTDVSIPMDAVLPRSRAAMAAMAEKMATLGVIQPGDIETFARIAELPGQKELLAASSPDTNRARRENYKMGQGRPAVPQPWDDHTIHIHEHHGEMKNMDWENAPEEIQSLFLTHLQAHETLAAEAAGKAQARANVSPMMATAPNAQGIPTMPLQAMPAQAGMAMPQPPGPGPADATAGPGPSDLLSQLPPELIAQLQQQQPQG